ncbi:nucleoside 2-deoxyribosyltransferase [Staphylococcus phage CF5]|uniref:Nucleoside 2-deoxyribosyltransferase n=1 Tax=Staphylococcus phage CF5 TaxID=3113739 RepID=A0AAX4J7H1_9CAUD|nr:nucleoside 2-deoxyribosyltransferase [Staphylococcus phage CF5]
MDLTTYKKIYLCGDMLHKAHFEYRKKQKEELEGIEGIEVYNPSSNDDINSKKTASSHKLAERIVSQDTKAIEEADIYVIDLPTADAGGRGTITELGQILQMKRQAQITIDRLEEMLDINYSDVEGNITEVAETLLDEIKEQKKILDKPVFIFSDDIRWSTTDMNDHMDRVPYSFNAYTYGVALYLTNGRGLISWEELLEELEKLGASNV